MSVRESSGGRVGSPDYHTLFMTGFPGQIERRELRNFFWNVDGLERIFIMKEFETHRSSTSLLLLFNSAFNAQSFFVLSRSRRIEFVSQADGEVHFVTCSVADSELSSTRGTHITVIGTRRDKAAASTGLSLPIPEPSPRHAERKSSGRSRPGRYVEEEEEDVSSRIRQLDRRDERGSRQMMDRGPHRRRRETDSPRQEGSPTERRRSLAERSFEEHPDRQREVQGRCSNRYRSPVKPTRSGGRMKRTPPSQTHHQRDRSPLLSSRQMVTPGFDDRRRENRLRSFYPDMTPNAASAHKEDVSRSKDLVQGRRSKDVHRSQSPQQRSHTGARGYSPSGEIDRQEKRVLNGLCGGGGEGGGAGMLSPSFFFLFPFFFFGLFSISFFLFCATKKKLAFIPPVRNNRPEKQQSMVKIGIHRPEKEEMPQRNRTAPPLPKKRRRSAWFVLGRTRQMRQMR
mmetsp:Transcript_40489/g.104978  ORF Transcript_40489/g.104978 Transcript_40489/m.104978 type:complete len:455 (-) Transcript_40489:296-1660(-)